MDEVRLDDLFSLNRFPEGGALLPLLFYFPFGLILACIRFFIGIHAFILACSLPKGIWLRRVILRCMCGVLGFVVTHDGTGSLASNVHVVAANYTSILDHMALYLCHPITIPCVWSLPSLVSWTLGYADMSLERGKDVFINKVKRHCAESKEPVLVFPEVATTSGQKGLMKFSTWPFSLDLPVQPVVVTLHRPILAKITPTVLGSWLVLDVFWFLFVPYTHFKVKILPVMTETEDEAPVEFGVRVQQLMASELGVAATSYTVADRSELVKRITYESSQHVQDDSGSDGGGVSAGGNHGSNSVMDEMTVMAHQVQAVLPHVPIHNIKADLALTKDVDLTVTNILEGRVQFNPVEPTLEAQPSVSQPLPKPDVIKVAHKQATQSQKKQEGPMKSLAERKKELYDNARRRYKEKHGLT